MEVDPIREVSKINEIKKILRHKNARDELLFIMGINTALRISDLLSLSVGDVVDDVGQVTETICVKEQKTGKIRRLLINESIKKTLTSYIKRYPNIDRSKPLFQSLKGGALSPSQAWRILHTAGKSAGLTHIGTHSLRKTFGYHAYKRTGKDLGLVQKMLNHSSSTVTLRYIGIDQETMENIFRTINL